LGYAQRGGSPTSRSRLLASLFGNKAVELLLKEQSDRVVGLQNGQVTALSLEKACKTKKPLDLNLLLLANMLAT
jgi:6-phosphofructokinase 1